MTLIAELQRRNVFKVGAGYLVVAWLVVQAASIGFPAFEAPPWALRIFILVALLGFPVALAMAWLLDLTPEGLRLDPQRAGNKRLFAIIALLMALALGWYFFGQPSFRRGDSTTPAAPATAASMAAPPATPAAPAVPQKSIAVLAFTDLSPAHDQEYFSDGMAEEILNALVRIKDLKVAGRTSSFYYKGRNEDLRNVGKALAVANVLEGSVRKQGDKVRITAQLVRTADGFHRWSQTYDGDLRDVFALQDQIARAITDELQVVLEGDQKQQLVPVATASPEAYALYLRATAVLNKRDYPAVPQAIAWLERALQLDPTFARGEAQLALLEAVGNRRDPLAHAKAERHAHAAMALDPTMAQPAYVLGIVKRDQRRFVEARQWLDKADAMQRGDASLDMYLGQWLIAAGYTEQGVERLDRALAVDPMLPNALNWRAYQYLNRGEVDTAAAMFTRADNLGLSLAKSGLAEVARVRGDFAQVRSRLYSGLNRALDPITCLKSPETEYAEVIAAGAGGNALEQARALQLLDECLATKPEQIPSWVITTLMRLHQPARALELLARGPSTDDAGIFGFRLWGPVGREMRRLPGFSKAAERIGFVDAWETYGPPDACQRLAPRKYICR